MILGRIWKQQEVAIDLGQRHLLWGFCSLCLRREEASSLSRASLPSEDKNTEMGRAPEACGVGVVKTEVCSGCGLLSCCGVFLEGVLLEGIGNMG